MTAYEGPGRPEDPAESARWEAAKHREPSGLFAMSPAVDAAVASVYDGDTIHVHLPLGTKPVLGVDLWAHDVSLRIDGCNARELADPGGKEARDNLRDLLPAGMRIRVSLGRDKYGDRRGANVTLPDGRDLATVLCEEMWAAPWDGRGARPVPPWPRPQIAGLP